MEAAWQLLQHLVTEKEKRGETALHRAVVTRLFSLGCSLPPWLTAGYKKRDPAELMRMYHQHGRLEAAAELAAAAAELAETPAETELWPPIADGVGGGIMAVIIETEDGEAISEATGVTESEPGLLSRPPVVEAERELATLRLI